MSITRGPACSPSTRSTGVAGGRGAVRSPYMSTRSRPTIFFTTWSGVTASTGSTPTSSPSRMTVTASQTAKISRIRWLT